MREVITKRKPSIKGEGERRRESERHRGTSRVPLNQGTQCLETAPPPSPPSSLPHPDVLSSHTQWLLRSSGSWQPSLGGAQCVVSPSLDYRGPPVATMPQKEFRAGRLKREGGEERRAGGGPPKNSRSGNSVISSAARVPLLPGTSSGTRGPFPRTLGAGLNLSFASTVRDLRRSASR